MLKQPRLNRSALIVSSLTFLSRLMGFARDIILAMTFGAGPAFDAFVIAFKIPNFMRRLFAEGAFAQAFVPVLSDYQINQPHQALLRFIAHIAGMLSAALCLVVLIGELCAPALVTLFAPGFLHDPVRFSTATQLLHITFPYLLLIGITAFAGATLNTFKQFAIPAFTPVLLNVAMILAACFWAPHAATPIMALAWGVLLGGLLQLLLQLYALHKKGLLTRPRLNWKDPGVKRVLTLMLPALFGVSVAQISLLIDNFFASFLPAGSLSWLYYSDRFVYLPQGVIGVALATVVLPTLSRHYSAGKLVQSNVTLNWALRLTLLFGLPSAIGLFQLAGPILTTLIHRGAFTEHDVLMTQKSLSAFAIGLPAFMLIKILASAFYAQRNIKTPVKIAAISLTLNLVFIFFLIGPLAHAGLALATALAAWTNAIMLLIALKTRKQFSFLSGSAGVLWRIITANALMACAIGYFTSGDSPWLSWGLLNKSLHLAGLILLGSAVYLIALYLLGCRKKHFIAE